MIKNTMNVATVVAFFIFYASPARANDVGYNAKNLPDAKDKNDLFHLEGSSIESSDVMRSQWHIGKKDEGNLWMDCYLETIEACAASLRNPENAKLKDKASGLVVRLASISETRFPSELLLSEYKKQIKMGFNSAINLPGGASFGNFDFIIKPSKGGREVRISSDARQCMYACIQKELDRYVLRSDYKMAHKICRLGFLFDSIGQYDGAFFYGKYCSDLQKLKRKGADVLPIDKLRVGFIEKVVARDQWVVQALDNGNSTSGWSDAMYDVPVLLNPILSEKRSLTDAEVNEISALVLDTVKIISKKTGASSMSAKSSFSTQLWRWYAFAVKHDEKKLVAKLDDVLEMWKKEEQDHDVVNWIDDIKTVKCPYLPENNYFVRTAPGNAQNKEK